MIVKRWDIKKWKVVTKRQKAKLYYKVTDRCNAPLHRGSTTYRVGRIYYENHLSLDARRECARGIYFCTAAQALKTWYCRGAGYKIFLVKPLGKVVGVKKGFRTDKLGIVKQTSWEAVKRIVNRRRKK